MESVAERLTHLRHSHNYSRKEVYEKLEILKSTYNRWETGSRVPDNDTILRFAEFYNVSPAYMFGFGHLQNETEFLKEVLEHIAKEGDEQGLYAQYALKELEKM
ncbi:helix-turn-helix domain-containing protein [Lactococcus taiwanensis]|uniref:helix-turn-helix domain-containing protein n=1 Tax=Lactococcus taiwanensis TaxID=1151742 RepID=UPI0019046E2A|nr:helix-turn-helix transcriptional regulator [Lactococcus taiwanensis]